MKTLASKILEFNQNLDFKLPLPSGIDFMNPFHTGEIKKISRAFYSKYYNDNDSRKLILGINPGRLGGGSTGIPFTDTKRLADVCDIGLAEFHTHEPSSVFIYKVIDGYGGPEKFYQDFYINSVCPLGFLRLNTKGNWVNCNYYDYKELFEITKPFIIESLRKQIELGMSTEKVFVLGKKNAKFLELINKEEHLFQSIVPLDHPRYIIQYKSKKMEDYVSNYIEVLTE